MWKNGKSCFPNLSETAITLRPILNYDTISYMVMPPILTDRSEERRILDFRPLGFRDILVLGRYSYSVVHSPLEEHCHGDIMEICYLERGEQTYFVGQQRFDLTGGDVFITFPGEKHGTGPSPEGKGALFWMLLQLPAAHRRFLSLSPPMGRELAGSLLHIPSRHFRGGPVLGRTLGRIFDLYGQHDAPLWQIKLQNLLLRFLLDLLEFSRRPEPKITPTIAQVQDFIARNICDEFTVRQLARRAGLSEPAFKARFKREVGIPPMDYVLRKKIDQAKRMLRSGQHTVTEVAMHLGFSTSQYFATVFRRYTGQAPGQIRRQSDS